MPKRLLSTTTPELELLEPGWGLRIGPTGRHAGFLVWMLLSIAWLWQPLATVIGRSLSSAGFEHYSHIALLPFISAYMLYLSRRSIFRQARLDPGIGIPVTTVGVAATWFAGSAVITAEPEYLLSLSILGLVTLWAGGFILCHGAPAFGRAAFPFLLLLFMVPFPPAVLSAVIGFLQRGSADASELMFGLVGMPVFRQGFHFALPGLTIHVAEECSGIRSSLALLISGLVMACLFLRTAWGRTAFVLTIVPLAILKNAIRIVVLSWLAVHIDPSFITGSIAHRGGGIPIFFASLATLGGLAWLLRRAEAWKSR